MATRSTASKTAAAPAKKAASKTAVKKATAKKATSKKITARRPKKFGDRAGSFADQAAKAAQQVRDEVAKLREAHADTMGVAPEPGQEGVHAAVNRLAQTFGDLERAADAVSSTAADLAQRNA